MKEYMLNCGDFNIIVLPERKQYFILQDDGSSDPLMNDFVAGNPIAYEQLTPHWFKYEADESWRGFDERDYRLNVDVSEQQLIDNFVLKKFNFGSLVALRDRDSGKVQIFKRDKLPATTQA